MSSVLGDDRDTVFDKHPLVNSCSDGSDATDSGAIRSIRSLTRQARVGIRFDAFDRRNHQVSNGSFELYSLLHRLASVRDSPSSRTTWRCGLRAF